jgi:ketosteroid isomerase-like protein
MVAHLIGARGGILTGVMPDESTTPDLVELTHQLWLKIKRQDWDAVLGFFSPDAVYDMSPVGLGTFEGHAAMRRSWEEWWGTFPDGTWDVKHVLSTSQGVVFVEIKTQSRVPGSASTVGMGGAFVYEWTDDKIARVIAYRDIPEARAAAERVAEERG